MFDIFPVHLFFLCYAFVVCSLYGDHDVELYVKSRNVYIFNIFFNFNTCSGFRMFLYFLGWLKQTYSSMFAYLKWQQFTYLDKDFIGLTVSQE